MSTPGEILSAIGRRLGRGAGEARVFRGRSVDELIPRIQRELGPDAIILRRREGLSGGVLGFFQQQWVEIDAIAGEPRLDVYDEQESATPALPPPAPAPVLEAPPAPAPRPATFEPYTAPARPGGARSACAGAAQRSLAAVRPREPGRAS